MSYDTVTGHRSMAHDRVRNDAYAAALARVIGPETVVLDLGSGLGLHGLVAARLGARRVYLVEPEDVIAVAEESARVNGLTDVVQVLHGRLEDVALPEPVDVIVSVLTGNMLFTEDLLPVLMHARDRYLTPGGALIPDKATLDLAPVTAPTIFAKEIEAWSEPQYGVTLSPARTYAANSVLFRWERSAVSYLAAPTTVHTVDLMVDTYAALHVETEFRVHTDGLCHGLAGWFTMRLGERWLSTAPDAVATHWSPALLPLDPPLAVSVGDVIKVQLDRAPYGDWTWRVSCPSGTQRHSTLLASPLKATTLRKAALGHMPTLSTEGQAVNFILSRCTGSTPVHELSAAVQQQWPDRYRTPEEALRFVQRIVKTLT